VSGRGVIKDTFKKQTVPTTTTTINNKSTRSAVAVIAINTISADRQHTA